MFKGLTSSSLGEYLTCTCISPTHVQSYRLRHTYNHIDLAHVQSYRLRHTYNHIDLDTRTDISTQTHVQSYRLRHTYNHIDLDTRRIISTQTHVQSYRLRHTYNHIDIKTQFHVHYIMLCLILSKYYVVFLSDFKTTSVQTVSE